MNAIIYSRVSTVDKQDNARQISELRDYAKYRKLDVLKIFEEKISGASKAASRKEFQNLLAFIELNKVDTVLVWELSRLGRSMIDVLNTIELLSEKGINIYIKKENLNTLEPTGVKSTITSMIISILGGFAEMERQTFRARSISGIRHNVANGGSGTGVVKAYGYKKVGKTLVVDPDEAPIVKLIFQKYLSGMGTSQVAKFLNAENIPTRYNKLFGERELKQKHGITKKGSDYTWKDGTVYTLLTNSIYKGERLHKGEVFPITPIVDADTFDAVQKRLSDNYNKKGVTRKNDNPLKDILICGKCGRGYFMHKRADNKDNAYKCVSKRYNEDCKNPSINIDKLLRSLFVTCAPIVLTNTWMTKDIKSTIEVQIQDANDRIKILESEIESLDSQMDNLVKLNLSGQISVKQFSKFKQSLIMKTEKKTAELELKRDSRKKLNDVFKLNGRKKNRIDETLFREQIKYAIKKIVVSAPSATMKVQSTFKNDTPVKITVHPVIEKLPVTEYILTRYTSDIRYMGDKKKITELIPLN